MLTDSTIYLLYEKFVEVGKGYSVQVFDTVRTIGLDLKAGKAIVLALTSSASIQKECKPGWLSDTLFIAIGRSSMQANSRPIKTHILPMAANRRVQNFELTS